MQERCRKVEGVWELYIWLHRAQNTVHEVLWSKNTGLKS